MSPGTSRNEAAEHDLHAFHAVRNMDEILISNFMVFADLVQDEPFDLWVGDEAWDIDYFLHENPELKRAPYAWMTDFVGWLPMPDGGDRERFLTADYNAEMIEQVARFPSLRDRSVFVGNSGDVVPDAFGDGLPPIRDWVERNYRVLRLRLGLVARRTRRPGGDPGRSGLSERRAGLRGHGRRFRGGRRPAPPGSGGLPGGEVGSSPGCG